MTFQKKKLNLAIHAVAILPAAVLSVGLAVSTSAAFAEGTIEQVLVTAQRREENLQSVPISVAAFSQEALQSSGVTGTGGLSQLVPSVQMVTSGPSTNFYVRGVGNSSSGTGEEGTNAFYVDGVFIADLKQTAMKFNNIERVEVLKGPQGTLFGRNSSGGLVNVITHEPGQNVEAKVNVGFANYETYTSQAYLAGPLTDTLSADIALTTTDQHEGWGKDEVTGKDARLGWDWGVRSKWVWRPNDATKITVGGEYAKSSGDFTTAFALAPGSVSLGGTHPPADPYDTNTPTKQFNDMELWGLNLTAEIDLDWATLTSITGTRENKSHSAFDADTGPFQIAGMDLANVELEDKSQSFQEELRLASNSDGPWSWQTGVFLLHTEANLEPQTSLGYAYAAAPAITGGENSVFSTLDTNSYAAFGEVSYHFPTDTVLTGGLRYTHDKLEFDGEQIPIVGAPIPNPTAPFSVSDELNAEEPTYRLAVRQDINENLNVYASYNHGFKSGTFSMSNITVPPVQPQQIDAYEVGVKSQLFDNRLRLNAAAFRYDISDYQVRATSPNSPVAILLNAAEVEVNGFELEFEAAATDNLRLFGSATWLNSEFSKFEDAPLSYLKPANCTQGSTGAPIGGAISCSGSATGNDTPLAPKFAGNLGATYTLLMGESGEMDLSAMYNYNDGYFFEPDNRLEQPAFSTVNASIAYRPNRNWAVELWGRNLDNETYYVSKLSTSISDLAAPAAPRTYGVNLKYKY
jgi:iron complex outermembrane receptor protein